MKLFILVLLIPVTIFAQEEQLFSVESIWTFEAKNHPISYTGYQEYQIVDTTQMNGKTVYVIEPGLLTDQDFLHRVGDKIYFWDDELQDFQLNYHFGKDSLYYINYYNQSIKEVDSVVVYVDSIVASIINGVNHNVQYCRSTLGVGNIEFPFKVIEEIGACFGGIRMPIGVLIDNITNDIQRIRCFANDTISYSFTAVSCDSSWYKTSTADEFREQLVLYPNPTFDKFFINGNNKDIEFKVYSTLGKLIENGVSKNGIIELEQSGIFILTLKEGDYWIARRILKLE